MLSLLSIKNFALIDVLEMNFSNHFSIITGETGAGKSILLGALGLVLGKRADLNSLKSKEEKCVIEAQFQIENYNLQALFDSLELDYESTTIIRREILPSGKSRAFVNDTPVNLNTLSELGPHLIDIHSQHQTRELSDESHQIEILDAVGQNQLILIDYKAVLKQYKSAQRLLKQYTEERTALLKEQDYNRFLLEELTQAQLKEGEQEALELEYEKLNNVELVNETLAKSWSILNQEQIGVLDSIKEVKNALQKIAAMSKDFEDLQLRTSSVEIELTDICDELHEQLERSVNDPERLTAIHEKLQLVYTLQKKHQVQTTTELIAIESQLNQKMFLADDLDAKIEKSEAQLEAFKVQLQAGAQLLTRNRSQAIPVLQKRLGELLSELGMPNAQFNFELTPSDQFLSQGTDQIQLLFSANKGMDFGLLKKVASGGELSRIMLAIKAILAEYSKLPTIIFDEIDTGVSGEIADKMGEIMRQMSHSMQVFAITHLPQIAAKGDQHYKVSKTTTEDTTASTLIDLSKPQRIREIAQMLSGKNITESALIHAEELLNK